LEVGTPDDLAESLYPVVPASPFLATLKHACYYGFYDLTQVQLSFFEVVSRTVPTTLFFPSDTDPSFQFAERFFDPHVRPFLNQTEEITRLPDARPNDSVVLSHPLTSLVLSVVGVAE